MIGKVSLALNTGSSSLKFACYLLDEKNENQQPVLIYQGSLTRIGLPNGKFDVKNNKKETIVTQVGLWPSIVEACETAFSWITTNQGDHLINTVGHRIVHGGSKYTKPQLITPELIAALNELRSYAPEHLPPALQAIEKSRVYFPDLPQVACFDTAFHRTMPEIAQTYPLPIEYRKHGLQKYGFHGLSYEFVLGQLRQENADLANNSRIIIAHLGHGASMAAIKDGVCIDTTMGFSPTGGFPMSTRTGDLDPEVVLYLLQHENVPLDSMKDLLNKKSGLLAISERSDDMKDLLDAEAEDQKSKFAVDYFCYHLGKHLGGLITALGGLDTLIFTAGIGEKSPAIRKRICKLFHYIGMEIDDTANEQNLDIISRTNAQITVRIVPTNEELIIAFHSFNFLK